MVFGPPFVRQGWGVQWVMETPGSIADAGPRPTSEAISSFAPRSIDRHSRTPSQCGWIAQPFCDDLAFSLLK
jgi:hypothetical protein